MIQKVELEITSDCNAACPGCARTLHSNHLKVNSFTFEGIKVSWCPSVKGTNIFYADYLEEIKHRYNTFIEIIENERKQKK